MAPQRKHSRQGTIGKYIFEIILQRIFQNYTNFMKSSVFILFFRLTLYISLDEALLQIVFVEKVIVWSSMSQRFCYLIKMKLFHTCAKTICTHQLFTCGLRFEFGNTVKVVERLIKKINEPINTIVQLAIWWSQVNEINYIDTRYYYRCRESIRNQLVIVINCNCLRAACSLENILYLILYRLFVRSSNDTIS